VRDPLHEGRAWRVPDLDLATSGGLEQEANALVGTHDFAGFRSSADQREDTVRTIHRVTVSTAEERMLAIEVTGSGFMHNMVRIIVGALVDIGRGRLTRGAFARCLGSKDRRDLGITAPPEGLYLWKTDLDMRAGDPSARDPSAGLIDGSTV
jgi:tRNA pseudouridine38-40 synthase